MADAFRCDDCGDLHGGDPFVLSVRPPGGRADHAADTPAVRYEHAEICGDCLADGVGDLFHRRDGEAERPDPLGGPSGPEDLFAGDDELNPEDLFGGGPGP
ncbi:hypothetical protein [Halomarina rubra]|uniref:Uncharacterized protein n=1 Tax=Halomarina rubra TaxID=2071873 RepID=A0ABD6ATJ3_9EURY|nr:hypothetical protein [Halomarina rubra]